MKSKCNSRGIAININDKQPMRHQNLLILLFNMSSAMSRQEIEYTKKTLFNRNKRYVDEELDKQKQRFEIQRRTPESRPLKSHSKFDSSFMNSTNALTDRAIKEIDKFKSRLSLTKANSFVQQTQTTRGSVTARTSSPVSFKYPNKVKGVPLRYGLKRKEIIEPTKGPADQRLFNNYQLTRYNLCHTPDLSKRTERNNIFIDPNINDLTYDNIPQLHDNFYYRQTPTKCQFELAKMKFEDARVFMFTKRNEDLPMTDLDLEKIQAGFEITNPYQSTQIAHFHNNSGRELPPQLQMKTMKQNSNYWTDGMHYKRPKLQFSLKQQRDTLREKRIKNIQNKKRPSFTKDEVCMEYYYRRLKT